MEQEVTYCTIIGAAPLGDSRLLLQAAERGDFLICADGGLDTARRLGVTPHLILGDFDSLQGEIPDGEDVIRLPVEKDDTDMLHAVKVGLQHGYRSFLLLGGLGGERPDHSMANFCVLRYLAEHGARGVLTDPMVWREKRVSWFRFSPSVVSPVRFPTPVFITKPITRC